MAAWIDGEVIADAPRMLIPIQEGGTNIPMCLVPPLEASAVSFVEFARALGPEQPVYAIDDASLPGDEWTMEELAAYYLSEFRAVRPVGPYVIGGRCFGAIIALEMTRQLEEQGEEVALLMILEGTAPEYKRPKGRRERYKRYIERLREHIAHGSIGTLLWSHLLWHWKKFSDRLTGNESTRKIRRQKPPQAVRTPIMIYESKQFEQLLHHKRWLKWANGGLEYQVISDAWHSNLWNTEANIAQITQDLKKRLVASSHKSSSHR